MTSQDELRQRECPVCLASPRTGAPLPRLLHHQSFASFSADSLMGGYDVVACGRCGAAYADRIPDQQVFDAYYAGMSKYEPSTACASVPPVFQRAADLLAPHLTAATRIADIGCATGAFLGELKRRSHTHLIGFDPSPKCCNAARRLYDVEVRTATISRLGEVQDRFDVVLSTGVLEHLRDVDKSLEAMISLLAPRGRMFIAVPDASHYHRWFSAPYQHFSMEHVNFFSPVSLTNLMARHGFKPLFVERVPNALGRNAIEPVLMAIFEQQSSGDPLLPMTFDAETGEALDAYIASSQETDERICAAIAVLVGRQTPLLVWGAGTHTLRLLNTSSLGRANIVAFVDRNQNYQGKTLCGRPIVAPEDVRRFDATILISSHVAEPDIKDFIQHELAWPTEPICLYEDKARDWPG